MENEFYPEKLAYYLIDQEIGKYGGDKIYLHNRYEEGVVHYSAQFKRKIECIEEFTDEINYMIKRILGKNGFRGELNMRAIDQGSIMLEMHFIITSIKLSYYYDLDELDKEYEKHKDKQSPKHINRRYSNEELEILKKQKKTSDRSTRIDDDYCHRSEVDDLNDRLKKNMLALQQCRMKLISSGLSHQQVDNTFYHLKDDLVHNNPTYNDNIKQYLLDIGLSDSDSDFIILSLKEDISCQYKAKSLALYHSPSPSLDKPFLDSYDPFSFKLPLSQNPPSSQSSSSNLRTPQSLSPYNSQSPNIITSYNNSHNNSHNDNQSQTYQKLKNAFERFSSQS